MNSNLANSNNEFQNHSEIKYDFQSNRPQLNRPQVKSAPPKKRNKQRQIKEY